MSENLVKALVSDSSRIGPVFFTKDKFVFVKLSKTKGRPRAAINLMTKHLLEYTNDPTGEQDENTNSDPSVFVPIFCTECYGTREEDYNEAALSMASLECDRFLIGACSVFGNLGLDEGEACPVSRADFFVDNDFAYSGACHLQPGKAVFLHKLDRDIGNVKCYWHVHSRSQAKTFLYCCVSCTENEYTKAVINPGASLAFSLGTFGDNSMGPITEECSLVPVPMRPGCFCTLVARKDLPLALRRMGFSSLKATSLEASIHTRQYQTAFEGTREEPSDVLQGESSGDQEDTHQQEPHDTETVQKVAVNKQVSEIQMLKDMLEYTQVENYVMRQKLKHPNDPDTLFTMRGAKDFSTRTGVDTQLCAGVKAKEQFINGRTEQAPCEETNTPEKDSGKALMSSMDNFTKQVQHKPLPEGSNHTLQQFQQQQPQQLQAQLHNLQSLLPLASVLLGVQQQQQQQQQLQQQQQQQQQLDFIAQNQQIPWNTLLGAPPPFYANSNVLPQRHSEHTPQYGHLTEEQKKAIALEYNMREAEKQAELQKREEKMLESIKASIRDAMTENHVEGTSPRLEYSQPCSETLESIAQQIPYKRVRKNTSDQDKNGDLSGFVRGLNTLRDIAIQLSSKNRESSESSDSSERECTSMSLKACETTEPDQCIQNKQQAGYTRNDNIGPESANPSKRITDFMSAVVNVTKT